MFSELEKNLQQNLKRMSSKTLFYVNIDRQEIWDTYLNGFSEETRQGNNCNCCKSFLRQYAGIVNIIDNQVISIWDNITAPKEYQQSINNLSTYIHTRPVTDLYYSEVQKCGTSQNLDKKRKVIWQHFYIELPKEVVTPNVGTLCGAARTSRETLERALQELTIDSTETILELIAQNSLYKGNEFEGLLKKFLLIQKEHKLIADDSKNNFYWVKSTISGAISGIRNTSIGTLLIDLSSSVELDAAVRKYESVVAPSNYKRPTALVTPKMIEAAKKTLEELGLLGSLERRFANETDININDVLYTSRPSGISDLFAEVAQDTLINPRTLSKIEEISIEDFLTNTVPTASKISVLLENSNLGNLVTLLTRRDNTTPSLFKWENGVSWMYSGGITDSMKERVKQAGGNVEGVLRFSIQWNEDGNNSIDFDAHAKEPNGSEIYFGNHKKPSFSTMMGQLDVDIISPGKNIAVENIVWSNIDKLKEGVYKLWVHNFSVHQSKGGFTAQVEFDGEIHDFGYARNLRGSENIQVAEVAYSKSKGFSIKPILDSKSAVSSREKWGVKTHQYIEVTKILLSPNYWDGKTIGNKHYLFMLKDCRTDPDEIIRPFFNEFLRDDLDVHRKVFEILGAKVKVESTDNQLSGVGFSSTQRAELIVQVESKFKRTLKIKF